MNMYRTLTICCLCLTLHPDLHSQSRDKDGYYIDLKGDTVFGQFINYEEPSWSPSTLPFKPAGSSTVINLTPDRCKRVSVDNSDNYISYQGKRQTNSVNYLNAETDSGDVFVDVSTFLLELYNNGHYHLFQFTDRKRPNFYVGEGEGSLRELSFKEFLNNGIVVDWPGFRLQLEELFRPILVEKPTQQGLIDHVSYNGPSLTDLFNRMAGGQNRMAHKRKYPLQIFVGAGAAFNSLKVTKGTGFDAAFITNEVGDYPSQSSPLFEAGVRFFSQRNFGRFFVLLNAAYYSFTFAHTFNDIPGGAKPTNTMYKSNVLAAPFGAGYKFIKRQNFTFDISAGAAMIFFLQNTETDDPSPYTSAKQIFDGSATGFSFFGEASVEFLERLSIYAAYYSPASVTIAEKYNAVLSSVRFGARVRIF